MRARPLSCVALSFSLALSIPVLRAENARQFASTPITGLLDQASRLSLALQLEEALAKVDEAIAIAERSADRPGLASAYRMKGKVLNRLGSGTDGAAWYAKALAEFEALGNRAGMAEALSGLTASAASVGDRAKVNEYGGRALALYRELGDEHGEALLLVMNARLPGVEGSEAERSRRILGIADRFHDDVLRASALRSFGASQFANGDLAGARTSLEAAISAYERVGDVESLAACYLNLGRVFRSHGDYEGALQRYQKAIDLLAPTKERYTIVEAVNSAAVALAALQRNREALAFTERGVALARESGNQRLIDFMEGNLAGSYGALGQHDRAIPLLQAVIARKPEPYLAPYRYHALADELLAVGRAAEAVGPIDEAVRLTREQKEFEILPLRLDLRADIFMKLNRLEEALRDSREAMALVEQTRQHLIPSDFLKRGYSDRVSNEYLRIVDLLSRLGKNSEALEVSERGRARAFLDLLAAREAGNDPSAAHGAGAGSAAASNDLASDVLARPLDVAGI